MEPVEITVDGIDFTALPMPDDGFQIFKAEDNLGKISREVEGIEYVRWLTADLFSEELAQKIGQAIQDKEM